MISLHFYLQPQYKYELFHINFTLITIVDVTVSRYGRYFFAFGLPAKTTICILKKFYMIHLRLRKWLWDLDIVKKYWQLYNYFTFSHCTARMAETSDSEEEPRTK